MVPSTQSSGLCFFPFTEQTEALPIQDRTTTEEESESLDDMDFLTRQKKLQAEAKMALAMAKPMAKMQVEVEKQNRKKSPVADLVSSGAESITDWGLACGGWLASGGCKWLSWQILFPELSETWVSNTLVNRH